MTEAIHPINITQNAISKVYSLMEEEKNLDLKLRIFVTGGGCSGFQYGFSFEDAINTDDFVIEAKMDKDEGDNAITSNSAHIKVVVDAMSMQYLRGANVDYRKDINGEQFIISNPNAKTTCGCGSSFSADPVEVKEGE
jgi:iron-sulfur cluster insertion protein